MVAGLTAFGYLWARLQNEGEKERGVDLLLSEGQRQVGLQYSTGDAQDFKTFGWVAGAVAGAALLATTNKWEAAWLVPLGWFLAAILCYGKAIWEREYERGTELEAFYKSFSGTLLEAKTAILTSLLQAIRHNDDLLPDKRWWYGAGNVLLVAAAIGAAAHLVWKALTGG
jgi:hypothetical protein